MNGTRTFGQRLPTSEYQCLRCGREAACNTGRDKPRTCRACDMPARVEATFPDQDWATDALCAQIGGEAFFPTKGQENRAAKAVCQVCPVRVECAAWALAVMPEHGVWGGLSAAERKRLAVVV